MLKSRPFKLKQLGEPDGLEIGQFKALVSVFGNVDSVGDMVMPGAFAKTLAEWEESGAPIPVLWSHRMDDPEFIVGQVVKAEETEEGLEILAQLDTGDGTPKAKATYNALKSGRTRQFSFAYDVIDGGPVEKDGQSYNELRELKLYEVSPTPIGANQETELLGIKRHRAKGAVGPHSTGTSGDPWDGPANQANLSNDAGAATYRKAYAWQDPDGDPDAKSSWKFIHHFVSSDGAVGSASTRACSAGIAILNGGRGGSSIPDADRQGVYNHLAKHLRDADMEPPELASKGLTDTGELYVPALKVGRVISAKNEATLREAVSSLEGAAKAIKSVLSALDSGTGDDADKAMQPSTASVTGPAKDEEPSQAKSEEPIRRATARLWEAELNLSETEGVRHAAY